jgi:large subunit ribosomal protein LP0
MPVDLTPSSPTVIPRPSPHRTPLLQALGLATKINKGTIELVADVHLIKAGDRVGASQATLLAKLGIKPFKYGLAMLKVYEGGSLFDSAVLDIKDEDMLGAVAAAVGNVAALCLATGFPTIASIPHSVINGYKNVLGLALATDYSFPQADKVREILADPSKFAAATAPAAGAPAAAAAPEKKEEKKEESEEEEVGDRG